MSDTRHTNERIIAVLRGNPTMPAENYHYLIETVQRHLDAARATTAIIQSEWEGPNPVETQEAAQELLFAIAAALGALRALDAVAA